jgi:hypothetical protein
VEEEEEEEEEDSSQDCISEKDLSRLEKIKKLDEFCQVIFINNFY